MTTRKPDYTDAMQLIGRLSLVVRDREAHRRECDALAQTAINNNREASQRVHEAVVVWRDVCAALTDGAGHDKRYNIGECIEAARELLGDTQAPRARARKDQQPTRTRGARKR